MYMNNTNEQNPLSKFSLYHSHPLNLINIKNRKCNICENLINGNAYSCVSCDLNLCQNCGNRLLIGQPNTTVHMHQLQGIKGNSWKCDVCKKKYNDCLSFNCANCNFDCCTNCYCLPKQPQQQINYQQQQQPNYGQQPNYQQQQNYAPQICYPPQPMNPQQSNQQQPIYPQQSNQQQQQSMYPQQQQPIYPQQTNQQQSMYPQQQQPMYPQQANQQQMYPQQQQSMYPQQQQPMYPQQTNQQQQMYPQQQQPIYPQQSNQQQQMYPQQQQPIYPQQANQQQMYPQQTNQQQQMYPQQQQSMYPQQQQPMYPQQQPTYPQQQYGMSQQGAQPQQQFMNQNNSIPHEHPVSNGILTTMLKCDICGNHGTNQPCYSCRQCDLDICQNCCNKIFFSTQKNIHHHQLLLITHKSDWLCNVCRNYSRKVSMNCKNCNYNCCINCYSKGYVHSNNHYNQCKIF